MDNKGFSFRKRLASFRYAFNGIRLLIRYEHNAWIHCIAAACAILAGAYFHLSTGEWIAVLLVIGGVFSAEAVNTAIESMADFISPGYHKTIKKVKDLAAGAVLIWAIIAALIGGIIFFPKIIALFTY